MSEPFISVVIPVRNGERHIGRCLEAIKALDWPADQLEVLVVDNGSTDRTVEIAKGMGAQVLHEPTQGACNARNAGWRAAKADLIAFTDCDCQPDPQWLREIIKPLEDSQVGGIGGHVAPDTPQTLIEEYIILRDVLSQERAMRSEMCSPPFLITANALYRREALESVNGFDPDLTVNGEDADLSWRVVEAGWTLTMAPSAVVIHSHRSSLRSFLRQVRSYGAGTTHLLKKHRERWGITRMTWWPPYGHLLLSLIKTPWFLLFGRGILGRLTPLFDFLGWMSFLGGKLGASVRLRVWNI